MRNVVFVTGGSGDIGREICREFADIGYPIAVGYNSDKQSAELLACDINSNGGVAMTVKCDVSDHESIKKAVSEIKSQIGAVEILINNAGAANIGLFTDLSVAEISKLVSVNLTGAMLCSKEVLPDMVSKKRGKIINITSVWGEVGASCEVVYSAAKSGLIGFTKALAKEYAPSGINVNAVSAGMIDTKMNGDLSAEDIAEIVDEIPISRIGKPSDIAKAVLFLASDKSEYISGQILRVDGGWQ